MAAPPKPLPLPIDVPAGSGLSNIEHVSVELAARMADGGHTTVFETPVAAATRVNFSAVPLGRIRVVTHIAGYQGAIGGLLFIVIQRDGVDHYIETAPTSPSGPIAGTDWSAVALRRAITLISGDVPGVVDVVGGVGVVTASMSYVEGNP